MLSAEDIQRLQNSLRGTFTQEEIELFIRQCDRTGLDPFSRQIHALSRRQKVGERWVNKMSILVGIDGFRLVAERTGQYRGQTQSEWCGKDGVWKDVWLSDDPPAAARVGVFRQSFMSPMMRIALWSEFAPLTKEGKPMSQWATMPALMLAKCAEAQALRASFPQELSGLYTADEMAQADARAEDEPPKKAATLPAKRAPAASAASSDDFLTRLALGIKNSATIADLLALHKKTTPTLAKLSAEDKELALGMFSARRKDIENGVVGEPGEVGGDSQEGQDPVADSNRGAEG